MPSINIPSGDPVADRRLLWAEALHDDGDFTAAAELLADVMPSVPHWAAGWYRLGEFYEAAGAPELASQAWDEARRADPSDRLGAALRQGLLAQAEPLAQMPSAFVETLFDAYAGDFDTSLAKLGYCGPELIARQLAGQRFGRALDLGCGTGLMGIELRSMCDWLGGCDISAKMLARAKARGIYDRLDKQDLTQMPAPERIYDLIAAADVVIYIGDLEKVVAWVSHSLRPGGQFVFTAETMPGTGYALGQTRRYRHSAEYLIITLTEAGFAAPAIKDAVLRQDRGEPVEAFVVTASLSAAPQLTAPSAQPETSLTV